MELIVQVVKRLIVALYAPRSFGAVLHHVGEIDPWFYLSRAFCLFGEIFGVRVEEITAAAQPDQQNNNPDRTVLSHGAPPFCASSLHGIGSKLANQSQRGGFLAPGFKCG